MEIIFVRHAEKESLGENPNITKKGIIQAKYLGKILKKEKIDDFYCSELNRAKQTAEIISKKTGIKPKIEKSLNEFESSTIKKVKNKWSKEEKSHYNNLISFLKRLTKNPNKERLILIVAHGITNRVILSYFLNLNLRNIIQFTQKEACLNSIYWKDKFKNWRLKTWNNGGYIPKGFRWGYFY